MIKVMILAVVLLVVIALAIKWLIVLVYKSLRTTEESTKENLRNVEKDLGKHAKKIPKEK